MIRSIHNLPSEGSTFTDAGSMESALPWILRIGMAGGFIGHGAFGVITKAVWVPYFAVGGIGEMWAWRSVAVVGQTKEGHPTVIVSECAGPVLVFEHKTDRK